MRFLLCVSTVNINIDDFRMLFVENAPFHKIYLIFEFLKWLQKEWIFGVNKYSALRNCHCMPVSVKQPFMDVCAGAGTTNDLTAYRLKIELSSVLA
uniref:Uncharacterized protein n=1 Tax=Brugia malayi TaxID=6279 RepID=A8PZI5_BRUMA